MTDLVLLDSPSLELAVFVDVDEFRPLPMTAAGPNRVALLEAFRDATPFDLTVMNDEALRVAFGQFLERVADSTEQASETADNQVDTEPGDAGDAGASLAEAEAHNAGTIPDVQPADTDQPQSSAVDLVTVRCWNCNGEGIVRFGDDEPPAQCNMCGGTGKVNQPAA